MSHPSNHPISCSGKKEQKHDFHFPPLEFSFLEVFLHMILSLRFAERWEPCPREIRPFNRWPLTRVGSLAMVQGHPLSFYKVFATQKLFCLLNLSCTGGLAKKKSSSGWINHRWFWRNRNHDIPSCVMWMWMVCFLLNQIVEDKIFRAHSRSSFEMEKSWISVKKINHSTMIDSIVSISTLLKFKSIYWRSKSFPHFSINRNWRYKFLPPFHLSEPFPSCLVPFGVRPKRRKRRRCRTWRFQAIERMYDEQWTTMDSMDLQGCLGEKWCKSRNLQVLSLLFSLGQSCLFLIVSFFCWDVLARWDAGSFPFPCL